jgi:hypothetical protein
MTYDVLAAFMNNKDVDRLFSAVSSVYLDLGFWRMMRSGVSYIASEERTWNLGVRKVQ